MPGTVVRDANAHDLMDGVDPDAEASDTGTAVEILWPQLVQFELVVASAETTSTLDVTIQGASNSAFDEDVVDIVAFPQADGNDDGSTLQITTYVDKQFIRASTVIADASAAADFTGTTLKVVPPHTDRVRDDFTA